MTDPSAMVSCPAPEIAPLTRKIITCYLSWREHVSTTSSARKPRVSQSRVWMWEDDDDAPAAANDAVRRRLASEWETASRRVPPGLCGARARGHFRVNIREMSWRWARDWHNNWTFFPGGGPAGAGLLMHTAREDYPSKRQDGSNYVNIIPVVTQFGPAQHFLISSKKYTTRRPGLTG